MPSNSNRSRTREPLSPKTILARIGCAIWLIALLFALIAPWLFS